MMKIISQRDVKQMLCYWKKH